MSNCIANSFFIGRSIYFLSDLKRQTNSDIERMNQNYVGMIEQVICANAHSFIGTPLSTFTGFSDS
jgi:hypothetical protein